MSKLLQPLPNVNNEVVHDLSLIGKILRPYWFWKYSSSEIKNFFADLLLGEQIGKIWHSTYYTDFNGCKGKRVVTVHDMVYETYSKFYSGHLNNRFILLKKKAISNADVIVCVSNATKQALLEIYPIKNKKIEVIYHAASTFFSPIEKSLIPQKYKINYPYILFVGKRKFNKNFNELIRTYSKWRKNKEIFLLVVGQKWDSYEMEMLNNLNINNKVVLIEDADDEKLMFLYNQALLLVYPSLCEGFGIPILESMSCACPIVASKIPTTIEIASEIPFYFTPGNLEEFENALNLGLESSLREEKINLGNQWVKKYTWDNSALQHYNLYKQLI